jgi:hypothetical protein
MLVALYIDDHSLGSTAYLMLLVKLSRKPLKMCISTYLKSMGGDSFNLN